MDCGTSILKDAKQVHLKASLSQGCSLTSKGNNKNNHKGQTAPPPNSTNDNSIQTGKDGNLTPNVNSKILDFCNGNTPPPQHLRKSKQELRGSAEKLQLSIRQNEENKRMGQQVTFPKKRETVAPKDTKDAHITAPRKDVFQFWERKVGHMGQSPEEQQRKQLGKSCLKVKPDNPRAKRKVESTVSSSRSNIRDLNEVVKQDSSSAVICQGRTARRNLLSESKDFTRMDNHVLQLSKQINLQEEWTTQRLVRLITEGTQSDLETVRAIWIWLCHNIKYDVDGFLGLSEKLHVPADVLRYGQGVCSGYSSLFKEMCREMGLTCQEVSGYSRGAGYRQGQSCQQQKSNHMWNAIKLDDEWYLLDACWGAGTVDLQSRMFIPRYDDFFFLTDPQDFIETHWPDDPKWQLMQSMVSFKEFEQRAFKTSTFFKLRLHIISPQSSLLRTVHGQVTISLGCEKATEFTYQLSRLCDNVPNAVNKAHGILTVSEKRMTLRVIPPTEGLFDLMIFAKPTDAPGSYSWVCSYQIECLQSDCPEALPENPFNFWGLHQKVSHFGIIGSNCSGDVIATDTGTVNLTFDTSRPLLAMYELVHEDLDDSLSKKCLVSQIEDNRFSCHVSCLRLGYYRVSVFVRNVDEGPFKNAANLLIHCSRPANHNELLPSGLSNHCGPGLISKRTGLYNPSHPAPIINTKHGKCNITFHTNPDIEVTAVLNKDQLINSSYPMERYILLTHLEQKVSVSVLLPESGLYKVGLFAKMSDDGKFLHICDYIIRCFSDPRWLPFPRVYSTWKKGCTLLQPRSGVLQEESWVRLKLRVPEACRVIAMGPPKVELHLTKSNIWEGNIFTGSAGNILKVAAKFSPHSKSVTVILSYDIGNIPNNVKGPSG